jgi:hypothetical protein
MLPRILGAAYLACNSASVLFAPNDPAIRNGELISALEFTEEAASLGASSAAKSLLQKRPNLSIGGISVQFCGFFRGEIRG